MIDLTLCNLTKPIEKDVNLADGSRGCTASDRDTEKEPSIVLRKAQLSLD